MCDNTKLLVCLWWLFFRFTLRGPELLPPRESDCWAAQRIHDTSTCQKDAATNGRNKLCASRVPDSSRPMHTVELATPHVPMTHDETSLIQPRRDHFSLCIGLTSMVPDVPLDPLSQANSSHLPSSAAAALATSEHLKIGRASCRERVF